MNIKDWVSRIFTTSSYPRPPGSENRDGFERNHDVIMRGHYGDDVLLRLSAAWSCVRLLAEVIGSLPLQVFEKQAGGTPTEASGFWLYSIVHDEPNRYIPANTFWEAYVYWLLLRGRAFARKVRDRDRVIGLELLSADEVTPGENRESWRYKGETIRSDDLLWTIGFTRDGITGLSPIEYGGGVFSAATLADVAARKTFKNGLMPTVAFSMKEVLQKKQRAEFRENFKSELGGALNAGKPPLLEGGMTAFPLGINPKDAQLLETRAFSIEEICRWFRVPPFMIGHASAGQTNWGTGIEQQTLGFLKFSLAPWLIRIEKSVALRMLSVAERQRYFCRFNVEGLLRADSAARALYLAQMTQNGLMTRNEGRAYDNRAPLDGGDVLTVQSNLVPLDQLGQATTSDAAQLQESMKRFLGIVASSQEN
jgi:HK97 family phage portal protein